MSISEKTYKVLKEAGWYPGRKIDITETVKYLEDKGFEVLDSAKKFMEEFGELNLKVERQFKDGSIAISKHTTCIKYVVGCGSACDFFLDEVKKEKVMLIGALSNFGTDLYISESGRVYKMIGWVGDNVWEAWDNIINEKNTIIWDKFKE